MFTLRIDSRFGWGGYRATVYGPGLPVVEPARDMGGVIRDLERAAIHLRKSHRPPFSTVDLNESDPGGPVIFRNAQGDVVGWCSKAAWTQIENELAP